MSHVRSHPFRRALAGLGAVALVVTTGSVLAPAAAQTADLTENLVAYTVITESTEMNSAQEIPEGCQLATIDPATGVVAAIGAAPDPDACVLDLAVAPDGVVWGLGTSLLSASVDTEQSIPGIRLVAFAADGSVDAIIPLTYDGTEPVQTLLGGLSVSADGTVHVMAVAYPENSGIALHTVNLGTGVVSEVGDAGEPAYQFGLTDCSSTLLTVDLSSVTDGASPSAPDDSYGTWTIVDRTTGEWSAGPVNTVAAYDCVSNETTLFGLAPSTFVTGSVESAQEELQFEFGTVNPLDGEFTSLTPITFASGSELFGLGSATMAVHRVTPEPVPPGPIPPTFTG